MRLPAIAGILVIGSVAAGPAIADDNILCVQQELTEHQLDPGPADGLLGDPTRQAALAFAATIALPMPDLTVDNAAEWCGVLLGWEAREWMPPVDDGLLEVLAPLRNDDPGAVPLGIWFDETVPTETRRTILEDLAWLDGLGPLRHTDELTAFLGLPATITGSDLLGWLVTHIAAIAADQSCPTRIISYLGATKLQPRDHVYECQPAYGILSSFILPPAFPEARAQLAILGEEIVVGTGYGPAVVYLTSQFLGDPQPGGRNRIDRLITLFHEAFHIFEESEHVDCTPEYLLRPRGGYRGCDRGLDGAYTAGALFGLVLAENCGCPDSTVIEILNRSNLQSWHIEIDLPGPIERPTDPIQLLALNMYEPPGPVLMVPPRWFFDARIRAYELTIAVYGTAPNGVDLQPRVRAWQELRLMAANAFPGEGRSWWEIQVRPPVPPLAYWPSVWLARALRSEESGFNVPLVRVRPCAGTPVGCESVN